MASNSSKLSCRFLFVYGTLREGYGADRKITHNGASFVSTQASAPGVRHGSIMCTFDPNEKNRVDGHLVLLPENQGEIMAVLDRYEGLSPNNDETGMYKRVIVDVSIPEHDFPIEAYAYHCNLR